jgi:hypothetical protein
MRTQLTKFTLAAGLLLALAFTFSCSGDSGGGFSNVGDFGDWWSATENYAYYAYSRDMYYYDTDVDRRNLGKPGIFSVRCVQD